MSSSNSRNAFATVKLVFKILRRRTEYELGCMTVFSTVAHQGDMWPEIKGNEDQNLKVISDRTQCLHLSH